MDPRVFARQQVEEQRRQAEQQHRRSVERHQQEARRFDDFVRELHQVATLKTEGDFEKFFVQKMVQRVRGAKADTVPDTRSSVSGDRMRRASRIFRSARTPAEGLKQLRKVDPELARTLQQVR